MKALVFAARHFGRKCSSDVLSTGVAEKMDGTGDYVLFTRELDGDADGDGIYFEFRDQIHSDYQIVDLVQLNEGLLSIRLGKTIESMPDIDRFDVTLALGESDWNSLRDDLRVIFEREPNRLKTQS